jgi:hypothetical protein
MSKRAKEQETLDTPRRQRLSKEIGKDKLDALEKLILEEVPSEGAILETPARERLRKEIGKEELERIEARILRGEL